MIEETDRQSALLELMQLALTEREFAVLLERAVVVAAKTLGTERCVCRQLHADGSTELRAAAGWSDDASETDGWSSLAVVIPGQSTPFGILSADSRGPRTFTHVEADFLREVGHILALVHERAASDGVEQQLIAAAQERAILEERQRLARDLHDSVTQSLYSVSLHAEAATRLLAAGDTTTTAEYLADLQEAAQGALAEMRLLIFELRPPMLEQIGLVATLRARLSAVEGRANLATRLVADDIGTLPGNVEASLYRIAQEALNNAHRHAGARHLVVELRRVENSIVLCVTDDGVGFDVAAAQMSGGMGLRSIAERVAQIAGTHTIRSTPGEGTQLIVEVPL